MAGQQSPQIVTLDVDVIEATSATQIRVQLDSPTIKDYALSMQSHAPFPPIVVFAETGSQRYILADGFARLAAAMLVDRKEIICELHEGGPRDALAYALSANDDHGLRRTNKDKRNAVAVALKDPEWQIWSATDISCLCCVSAKFVRKVRSEMTLSGEIEFPQTIKTMRAGKEVERKSTRAAHRDRPDEPDSSDKTATSIGSKSKRGPKTQLEIDVEEIRTAIELIKGIAMSGDALVMQSGSYGLQADFDYCRDWFSEAAGACKTSAA